MSTRFWTFGVLKLEASIILNEPQRENISLILKTSEVSKFDKPTDFKLWQDANTLIILLTEGVFIFPKVIFSKLMQLSNIDCILVTLEVSKFDKFIYFILLNPLNIFSQVVISSSKTKVIELTSSSNSQILLHTPFFDTPFTITSEGSM